MIKITQSERKRLEEVGLFVHAKTGHNKVDSNFKVVNKKHPSRAKTTYVVETYEIMRRLEKWDRANVMPITDEEYKILKDKKILFDKYTQTYDHFVPRSSCFKSSLDGQVYIANNNKFLVNEVLKLRA